MNGYRHEEKYFISTAGYLFLRGRLESLMQLDSHAVRRDGRYLIRSLYFDDRVNSGLSEKVDGIEMREKFRIRLYDHDDTFIRLEDKQKHNQLTRKLSAPVTREQVERILRGDLWWMANDERPAMRKFYIHSRTAGLQPAVIVDYMREAYLYRDVRITFDMDLRSGLYRTDLFDPNIPTVPLFPGNRMILEVKFDDMLPDDIRRLLSPVPAVRSAISKYELCRRPQ